MKNKIINIIRPIENAAEKEYLKEFFRFIGCFLEDLAVDNNYYSTWDRALRPSTEEGGVDIVLNYFGEDPHLKMCELQGIKGIYCYFSFYEGYTHIAERTLMSAELVRRIVSNKPIQRETVLGELISAIWQDEPKANKSIQQIAALYTDQINPANKNDLFRHIQTRRCLRFLTMGEVLNEPAARVSAVRYTLHLRNTLEGLWKMWVALDGVDDAYSRYTQIKAAKMMSDIVQVLHKDSWKQIQTISYDGKPFLVPSKQTLIKKLQVLIDENPEFLSAHLYLAGLCRYIDPVREREDTYYLDILHAIPGDRRYYAFIWYRLGHYYEKRFHNRDRALRCYQKAAEVDDNYYQALFKLGYYAAERANYQEAEYFMMKTLRSLFRRRSNGLDEEIHHTWQYLSQKEIQYTFKAYMMLAKIAIKTNREYSAKAFIGNACSAALAFERAHLIFEVSTEPEFINFWRYHRLSEPLWAMWKILEPWTEDIILDFYVRDIVREKLKRWIKNIGSNK